MIDDASEAARASSLSGVVERLIPTRTMPQPMTAFQQVRDRREAYPTNPDESRASSVARAV